MAERHNVFANLQTSIHLSLDLASVTLETGKEFGGAAAEVS
jgi:hypothetical protein